MTWCGRLGEMKEERPTIVLLLDESSRSIAGEVGIGAEEEGVPLAWDVMEGDAKKLAWEAANRSRLRVGIGVTQEGCALTLANLDPGKPLIYHEDGGALRWLGQAAARLVKGLPLPPMPQLAKSTFNKGMVGGQASEQEVAAVIAKVLRQMGLA